MKITERYEFRPGLHWWIAAIAGAILAIVWKAALYGVAFYGLAAYFEPSLICQP